MAFDRWLNGDWIWWLRSSVGEREERGREENRLDAVRCFRFAHRERMVQSGFKVEVDSK